MKDKRFCYLCRFYAKPDVWDYAPRPLKKQAGWWCSNPDGRRRKKGDLYKYQVFGWEIHKKCFVLRKELTSASNINTAPF